MPKNTSKVVAALRGLESNLKKILREVERPDFGAARAATGAPKTDRDPVRDALAAPSSGTRWTPERIERELSRQAAEAPRVPDEPEVAALAAKGPTMLTLAREIAVEWRAMRAHGSEVTLAEHLKYQLSARANRTAPTSRDEQIRDNMQRGQPMFANLDKFRTA